MTNKHKLAIVGGTGKSGTYLVSQLLLRGYPLRLLIRSPQNFSLDNPLIELVKGDARKFDSIQALLDGCHTVISTLGQPSGESPIFSQATTNIIHAASEASISRYILTTGLNVDTPLDKKGTKTLIATDWMRSNYSATTLDKQLEFEILSKSNLKWTLVRLPLIKQITETGQIRVSLEDCPGDSIGAIDLASFLIDQISNEAYVQKAPFIANV